MTLPFRLGVNVHPIWTPVASIPQLIAAMHSIGVQAVRFDAPWQTLEPTQGGYEQNYLARLDAFVTQCAAAGIETLALPTYTPGWANGGLAQNIPPTNPADFAAYCAFLVQRWPTVKAIEILNEPDMDYAWAWSTGTPQQRAQAYVELLQAAYPAVKAANPGCYVLAPAIASQNATSCEWLTEFFAAGAHGSFDILSYHLYGDPPSHGSLTPAQLVQDALAAVTPILPAAVAKWTPVWITETGWNTIGVTEAQQAENLTALVAAASEIPELQILFWYELQDDTVTTPTAQSSYGLFTPAMAPKPASAAFHSFR